jgi:anti-sigma regulatory factor (Ser/Thr protein kinase)
VTSTPSSPLLPDGRFVVNGFSRWVLASLEPRPERVPYLRRQVERVLHLWHLEALAWRVELVVTELATNAVRHARTLFTVAMTWDGRRLRIEVSDAQPVPPRPADEPPSPDATGGRGLLLVEQLTDRWGYDPHERGKTIWCDLLLPAEGSGCTRRRHRWTGAAARRRRRG